MSSIRHISLLILLAAALLTIAPLSSPSAHAQQPTNAATATASPQRSTAATSSTYSPYAPMIMKNPHETKLPVKVGRHVMRLMDRYDLNTNSQLEQEEWSRMSGSPQSIDIDADKIITIDELTYHVADFGLNYWARLFQPYFMQTAGDETLTDVRTAGFTMFQPVTQLPEEEVRLGPDGKPIATDSASASGSGDGSGVGPDGELLDPDYDPIAEAAEELLTENRRKYYKSRTDLQGLPAWFIVRDIDGDGQVTMVEFSPELSSRMLAQFGAIDRNGDGIISPAECRGL